MATPAGLEPATTRLEGGTPSAKILTFSTTVQTSRAQKLTTFREESELVPVRRDRPIHAMFRARRLDRLAAEDARGVL